MDYISAMIFLSKKGYYQLQRYICEIFQYLSSCFHFNLLLLWLPLSQNNFQRKGDNCFKDTL